MLAPLLLSLLAVAITLGRAWRHRKEAEEDERISGEDWRADAWRRCLLPVMIIMFIAVPPAASFAFRALTSRSALITSSLIPTCHHKCNLEPSSIQTLFRRSSEQAELRTNNL